MNTPRLSAKLDDLPATLDLLADFDPASIATALSQGSTKAVLAIGSGGSVVAAEFFTRCRDSLGFGPTPIATPTQAVTDHSPLRGTQVWLFSAGGDNPDICAAVQGVADRGCRDINLMTRNPEGAAAKLVDELAGHVHLVPVADVKDGYLATHSLLAMTVSLLLASTMVSREPVSLPSLLETIAARITAARDRGERARLANQWKGFRTSDTLIVVSDPLLKPVATLLDTSLWEASLCPVQTTDFRNLAHGRHAWLHHRTHETVLLGLTGNASSPTWTGFNEILPDALRRLSKDYNSCGRLDNILGLIDGLAVIEAIGEVLGIDPGKPGIGEFGRAMYADRSLEELARQLPPRIRHKRAAMAKADTLSPDVPSLMAIGSDRLRLLEQTAIKAAVFDYDGTIVSTADRFKVPEQKVTEQLVRLHRAGLVLGIATGRGGSAGEDLRKVLPADILPSVVIGYYNGGYLRTADVDIDLEPPAPNLAILAVAEWLGQRDDLFREKKFKAGPVQICVDMDRLRHPYRFAVDLALCPEVQNGEVRISASGHSFDIIPASSTKLAVVEAIRKTAGPDATIFCFGDSGATAGNDHALLAHAHGISVGEVCGAANGCWSLFGSAVTGPEALLKLLSALVASPSGEIRLDLSALLLDSRRP